jgi:hypothetical protein
MSSKKSISRKDFIKGCSATVGLMSLGLANLAAAQKSNNATADEHGPLVSPAKNTLTDTLNTKRGSWLADAKTKKAGDVSLISGDAKCVIVVSKKENSAVQQAAMFLAADIEKISSYKPAIRDTNDDNIITIHLITMSMGNAPTDARKKLKDQHEAYYIKTEDNKIWLVGSDFRGTAFAAYAFAERIGIDPLYHWTGYQPEKHPQLTVKAIDYYSPPPVFKYRGFFNDDEDVLPRPFERSGYPLRVGDIPLIWYQRYFETALRLGMNMAAPFCRVHRRYEVQKCASDWGLYYTSHHYDILLSNPFGIERFRLAQKRGVTTDWDWFKSKDNMMRYWRGGVEENKDINAIWPVGLRGTDDHAYEFPKNTPADVQAAVFGDAINTQVTTVKSIAKRDAAPLFHFTMYTEMLEKYERHSDTFNVPEDVIIVWPDNDDGVMRSLPSGLGKWQHGVYYHLAYFGKDISKQGPHVVSPARIAQEFKKIKAAGATEFLLVNVSEMREQVMGMRMIANFCHDATMFDDAAADKNFTKWWLNEYFGSASVNIGRHIYQQYYQLFNITAKVWFGNDTFQNHLALLLKKINGQPFTAPDTGKINELQTRITAYRSIMVDITAVEKTTLRHQKQFFFENVTLGLLMDYCPCQAAASLLKALNAVTDTEQWQYVEEAMQPLQLLETALAKAERGPFDKWYIETWIKTDISPLNYHRSYKQLRELISTGGQMQITNRTPIGHNIPGAQLWFDYLEAANKINPSY